MRKIKYFSNIMKKARVPTLITVYGENLNRASGPEKEFKTDECVWRGESQLFLFPDNKKPTKDSTKGLLEPTDESSKLAGQRTTYRKE